MIAERLCRRPRAPSVLLSRSRRALRPIAKMGGASVPMSRFEEAPLEACYEAMAKRLKVRAEEPFRGGLAGC